MKKSGRELVASAMRREKVDRIPWVPFVGCHGGALIGKDAQEYLCSAELLKRGFAEAHRRYRPDGLPVVFDLQIEAEALGCKLIWSKQNPPAVVSHPLEDGSMSLDQLKLFSKDEGRIGLVLQVAQELREAYPDLALYGLITGPFTLATHLLGTTAFMTMLLDEPYMYQLMSFCNEVAMAMASWYCEAGCDTIAVVDPMTSQIGPEQFTQFVGGPASVLFNHIRACNATGSFFVCGFAQQNIEAMANCKPDNISIDENIPLSYVADICKKSGISFGGNLQLTTVLLLGTAEMAAKNAVECIDTGTTTGFILAPGCDLPYATPPENLEAVSEVVHNPYQQNVARALKQTSEALALPMLPDYESLDYVAVDIITLDSGSCAPCQYMVEAIRQAVDELDCPVQWKEHSIKTHEGIAMMQALGVKNIPTTCINGKPVFISRIPSRDSLKKTLSGYKNVQQV